MPSDADASRRRSGSDTQRLTVRRPVPSFRRLDHRQRAGSALLVLAVLTVALLATPVPVAAREAADPKAKAAELEQLRARIRTLQENLESARGRRDTLSDQLRQSEREVGRTAAAVRRIGGELERQQERLRELQVEQQHATARIAAQRDALARQVRAAYVTGRQEHLKILLNQEDPARIGRALVYYDYFHRARVARIAQITAELQRMAALEAEIAAQSAQLEVLRQQREAERLALDDTRAERARLLASVNAEITDKDRRLERLQQDESRLRKLLEDLQRALADFGPADHARRPFAKLKGGLPWPVRGRLAARFGDRREVGELAWRGVLIDAPAGTDVRAISHGRVAFADWLRGFGLLVILDHGDGYMSLYGHNQTLTRETGDWVVPGDTIATVGDSGGQARSGLYFELRHRGEPINPLRWCRAMGERDIGMNP